MVLTCETFGISRQAYYAARRRAELVEGTDRVREAASDKRSGASAERSNTDSRPPWATAEELRAVIHEIAEEHVAWGVRKVWATLRRRGLRAGQKRVWAIMKADGLTQEPSAVRESPGRYGHVTVPESNRRWATDLTTVWTRNDGTVAVVPVIDCGDRTALACAPRLAQSPINRGGDHRRPENSHGARRLRGKGRLSYLYARRPAQRMGEGSHPPSHGAEPRRRAWRGCHREPSVRARRCGLAALATHLD